jgi:RNA polymerase sigma-70 factor (ECF subfamily)
MLQSQLKDDLSLLDLVRQGSEQALTSLHQRYSRLVFSVALATVREYSTAEDVHQEVFMQLWKSPHSFMTTHRNFSGVLAATSRNRSIDLLRRRQISVPIENVVAKSPTDLVAQCEHSILMERVRTKIEQLPKAEQELLSMSFIEGWTHSEISTLTGQPLGTVKTRIRNAIITLRGQSVNH